MKVIGDPENWERTGLVSVGKYAIDSRHHDVYSRLDRSLQSVGSAPGLAATGGSDGEK